MMTATEQLLAACKAAGIAPCDWCGEGCNAEQGHVMAQMPVTPSQLQDDGNGGRRFPTAHTGCWDSWRQERARGNVDA